MSTLDGRAARDRFGGVKLGASFLGFSAAYGLMSLVSGVAALLALAAGAVGLVPTTGVEDLFYLPEQTAPGTNVVAGLVVGLVAVCVGFFLGGYVAGRMARFDGARQGVAVWLWGLLVGVGFTLATFGLQGSLDSMGAILATQPPEVLLGVLVVVAVQLVVAVLGGLAGMRFHRRVDRAETEPVAEPVAGPDTSRDTRP